MTNPTFDASQYTYNVTFSDTNQEYIGLCAEFPSLSHLDKTRTASLQGIKKLVANVVSDMLENNEELPVPLKLRNSQPVEFGPSNDDLPEVQLEIRAAQYDCDPDTMDFDTMQGWIGHSCKTDPSPTAEITAWHIGWLARELSTHRELETRDANAWPWDPTRSVAGQYEERYSPPPVYAAVVEANRRARQAVAVSLGLFGRGPSPQTEASSNVVEPGLRHAMLKSLAGAMRCQGCGYEEIESALLAANKVRCNPPKSDTEVKSIARWAAIQSVQLFSARCSIDSKALEPSSEQDIDGPPRTVPSDTRTDPHDA